MTETTETCVHMSGTCLCNNVFISYSLVNWLFNISQYNNPDCRLSDVGVSKRIKTCWEMLLWYTEVYFCILLLIDLHVMANGGWVMSWLAGTFPQVPLISLSILELRCDSSSAKCLHPGCLQSAQDSLKVCWNRYENNWREIFCFLYLDSVCGFGPPPYQRW